MTRWFIGSAGFRPALLALLLAVGACADAADRTGTTYPDPDQEELYRYGSVLGGEGGFSLFGPSRREEAEQGAGIGVNTFLWRASLDTLSFMPVTSADPFGGVILTDWYSPPDSPDERFKVNLYILDRQLRADGVRASVFRQMRDGNGGWRDAAVAEETSTTLENAILTRARQLRIAQTASQ